MPAITEGTYQPQPVTAGMPGSSESHAMLRVLKRLKQNHPELPKFPLMFLCLALLLCASVYLVRNHLILCEILPVAHMIVLKWTEDWQRLETVEFLLIFSLFPASYSPTPSETPLSIWMQSPVGFSSFVFTSAELAASHHGDRLWQLCRDRAKGGEGETHGYLASPRGKMESS